MHKVLVQSYPQSNRIPLPSMSRAVLMVSDIPLDSLCIHLLLTSILTVRMRQ